MEIRYIKGDATAPEGEGNKIIVHVCNDIGAWGKGFVLAISKKWKAPEIEYKKWAQSGIDFQLGSVQFVQVESSIWVANVIGQRDIRKDSNGLPPIRYEAVEKGLEKVKEFAKKLNATAHMPRIGCGLAGGTWDKIEPLIQRTLIDHSTFVVVYDLVL